MQIIKKIQSNFSSFEDVALFVRIYAFATVLPVPVKLLSVPRLMEIITPRNTKEGVGDNSDEISDRIERYTLYLLNRNFWIYKNICLKRSLILYHFLRKYGIAVTLCFGVRHTQDPSYGTKEKKMEGHAWLLYKGDMFQEKNMEESKTFTVTYCYPEHGEDAEEKGFITDYEEADVSLSNEKSLLLLFLDTTMSDDRLEKANSLLALPIDWDKFRSYGHSQGIAPLVYQNVKDTPRMGRIPKEEVSGLRKAYHSNVARNMYLYAELTRILRAMYEKGIDVMVLKGAALAGSVYGHIGLRTMGDIDLLVKKESLYHVKKIMTDLGYIHADYVKPEEWYRENHFHLPPYVHKEKSSVVIEIHWHICDDSLGIDVNEWWENAIMTTLGKIPVHVPSPEDMVLHSCISLYHGNYQTSPIRSLCDISETLRHFPGDMNWKLFHESVGKSEIAMHVYSILYLVRKYFGGTQQLLSWIKPESVDPRLKTMMEQLIFNEDDDSCDVFMRLLAADTKWKKVIMIFSDIFPSQEKMSERYSLQPDSLKVYFYYAYRPLELVVKYGRSLLALLRLKKTH